MTARMVEQHEKLERILGSLAEEGALEELEDRAYDAAHLEEEHYALLLAAGPGSDDEAITNLKRHVLFCDLCSTEFLSRAAPEAESEFHAEEAEASRRRWFRLTALVGALAFALGLLIGVMMGDADGDVVPSAPTAFAEAVRGGTGKVFGRNDAADRLFLELRATDTRFDVHLHVFVVAGAMVAPLHPAAGSNETNPVPAGVLPAGGWADPGGTGRRTLVGVLSASPLPLDMTTVAGHLRRRLADGGTIQDLARTLDELRGDVRGGSFLLRLEE